MEFEPKTYEEWLEHHHRVSGPALVKTMTENYPQMMVYGKIRKPESE